jgi:hypothetical protein
VARLWTGQRWVDDAVIAVDDEKIGPVRSVPDNATLAGRIEATLLPALTDAHVHIGLSDFVTHGGGVLARVLDLGWDPAVLSTLESLPEDVWPATELLWAGPFLTAPGGYPSDRAWAAEGTAMPIADTFEAAAAVEELRYHGVCVIKISLNANAGPVFSDEVLEALVETAHENLLKVVAHVEGHGQVERATLAGVDWFSHAPWERRLSDDELRFMVDRTSWISTLDMHGRGDYGQDYRIAVENVNRFLDLGGWVVYGTDLGNAITSTDLNLREVDALRAARMDPDRLLHALTGHELLPTWSRTATLLPSGPADAHEAVDALPTSRPVSADQLTGMLS